MALNPPGTSYYFFYHSSFIKELWLNCSSLSLRGSRLNGRRSPAFAGRGNLIFYAQNPKNRRTGYCGSFLNFIIILLFICIIPSQAAINDPFPMGYSMLNFGTIIQGNRISGRQPWIPACFAQDTSFFSLSSAYVNFYDAMDNLQEEDFRQAAVGFWLNLKRVGIKGSGTFFNALGIYEEQKGFLSIGTSITKFINISAELEAYRAGLKDNKEESETLVSTGFSLWVPWSFASASLSLRNITVENASQAGFRQPFSISLGMHSMPHRFGSQGVLIIIEPEDKTDIRLCIGQELFIHKTVGLNVAVSSKPLMASFGVTFNFPSFGVCPAFVYHPVLGWSQGVGMEYVKRKE